MPTEETWRLFVAIVVPDEVKDSIEAAQAELRSALPKECARWTQRAQFHLTLKFLGDVEASRIAALVEALRGVGDHCAVLRLRAERIGFFPDPRFPRVIWARVHDAAERLPVLQRAVETAVAAFTAERPEGTFTGHITLGRGRMIQREQADILARMAAGMANRLFGEWTADHLELIRSDLAPGGSRYTTLAAIPLKHE
jgi:2'-5' RNA ligase